MRRATAGKVSITATHNFNSYTVNKTKGRQSALREQETAFHSFKFLFFLVRHLTYLYDQIFYTSVAGTCIQQKKEQSSFSYCACILPTQYYCKFYISMLHVINQSCFISFQYLKDMLFHKICYVVVPRICHA